MGSLGIKQGESLIRPKINLERYEVWMYTYVHISVLCAPL